MKAIILDTETTGFADPVAVEVAWAAVDNPANPFFGPATFNQRFNPGKPIEFGAMATHHIVPEDLVGCPPSDSFALPEGVEYLVGHKSTMTGRCSVPWISSAYVSLPCPVSSIRNWTRTSSRPCSITSTAQRLGSGSRKLTALFATSRIALWSSRRALRRRAGSSAGRICGRSRRLVGYQKPSDLVSTRGPGSPTFPATMSGGCCGSRMWIRICGLRWRAGRER